MDAQNFRSLQEAYMEIVENQQLDEISVKLAKRAKEERWDRTGAAMEKDRREGRKKPSPEFQASYKKAQDTQRRYEKKVKKEQVDFYDIILSHLLDEGYAETVEAAEKIMVSMSEEWRESIVEEKKTLPVGRMDDKAKELKKRFLNSKPGSPEAARLISRASQITGTRDKKIV